MRTLRYTLCDVFTAQPLTGNALAVFTGAGASSEATLLAVAREMNLSETVFVLAPSSPSAQARLRIFTPARELPFAGHPILGAAAVVGRTITVDVLTFETGGGLVPVALGREGAEVRSGRMLQPLPRVEPYEFAGPILAALGLGATGLPIELYDNGPRHVLVPVGEVATVRALAPDLGRLGALHAGTIAVFARLETGLEARVFAPGVGVPEDPATGSAAGAIAAWCVRHGWAGSGESVEIRQGAAIHRPSRLLARATGSRDRIEQVEVEGEVVVLGRGELRVPIGG